MKSFVQNPECSLVLFVTILFGYMRELEGSLLFSTIKYLCKNCKAIDRQEFWIKMFVMENQACPKGKSLLKLWNINLWILKILIF